MAETQEGNKKVNKGPSGGNQNQSKNYKNPNYKRYNKNKPYDKGRQNRSYPARKREEGRKVYRPDPANETIDDIKKEILRIEKEIELEIKEIRSMKLSL